MASPWHDGVKPIPVPAVRRVAPDRAVRAAELIVWRAWVRELRRELDDLRSALRTAFDACDAAVLQLVAAQQDGSPWRIGVARAGLLLSLERAQAAADALDRARRALREQIHPLTRRPRRRTVASAAVTGGASIRPLPRRRAGAARPPAGMRPSATGGPPGVPRASPQRLLPPWLRRFGRRRTRRPVHR